jgi:hypothetical protein
MDMQAGALAALTITQREGGYMHVGMHCLRAGATTIYFAASGMQTRCRWWRGGLGRREKGFG